MRTTVDVPDDLMRQAKALAAMRGVKLKDLITDFISQGLRSGALRSPANHRSKLPALIPSAERKMMSVTNEDVEKLIFEEDQVP